MLVWCRVSERCGFRELMSIDTAKTFILYSDAGNQLIDLWIHTAYVWRGLGWWTNTYIHGLVLANKKDNVNLKPSNALSTLTTWCDCNSVQYFLAFLVDHREANSTSAFRTAGGWKCLWISTAGFLFYYSCLSFEQVRRTGEKIPSCFFGDKPSPSTFIPLSEQQPPTNHHNVKPNGNSLVGIMTTDSRCHIVTST